MGEGKIQDHWFQYGNNNMKSNQDQHHKLWMIDEGHEEHHDEDDDEVYDMKNNDTLSSSMEEVTSSTISNGSCSSSLDTTDDASSLCSPNSDDHALYDLSSLMAQLPIKRGLSKFYQGKSQSFTSLSRVTSLEDLAKKESPYRRKIKSCKSYGTGLDSYKSYTLPKPTILKKTSRSSFSVSCTNGKASFMSKSRPPLIPVQRI